jgi:hypothetical protein
MSFHFLEHQETASFRKVKEEFIQNSSIFLPYNVSAIINFIFMLIFVGGIAIICVWTTR